MSLQISASLLAADPARLGEEIQRAEASGVDSIHFDMMDGHYAPNLAFGPDHLAALRRWTRLPFLTHLELSNPDEVLDRFGPLHSEVLIVQWDTLARPAETFERIRSRGVQVGLGLGPGTPVREAVALLPLLDLLLILGVSPGFGGQAMHSDTPERVRSARAASAEVRPGLRIAVDGGVGLNNAASLVEAGADCLIMGTALFRSPDMQGVVRAVREAAGGSLPR